MPRAPAGRERQRRAPTGRAKLGPRQPAVRPADDRVRAAVRPGAPHAIRRRAVGAGARRRLCRPGAWMRAAPRLALAFEGSLAVGVVFADAGDPVRARRAQHRRRLGARRGRRWSGSACASGAACARCFGYALLLLPALAMLSRHEHHGATDARSSTPTLQRPARRRSASLRGADLRAALRATRVAARHGEASAEPVLIGLRHAVAGRRAAATADRPTGAGALQAGGAGSRAPARIALLVTGLLGAARLAAASAWPMLAHAPLHAAGAGRRRRGRRASPLSRRRLVGLAARRAGRMRGAARRGAAWPAAACGGGARAAALSCSPASARCRAAPERRAGRRLASAWPWLGWLVVPAAAAAVAAAPRHGAALAGAAPRRSAYARRRRPALIAAGPAAVEPVGNIASDGARRRCRTCRCSIRSTSASASRCRGRGCGLRSAGQRARHRQPALRATLLLVGVPGSSGSTRCWCAPSTTSAACRTRSPRGPNRSRCRPASRCCGPRPRWR